MYMYISTNEFTYIKGGHCRPLRQYDVSSKLEQSYYQLATSTQSIRIMNAFLHR